MNHFDAVVEYMRGRRGIDWGLYEFANIDPPRTNGSYSVDDMTALSGVHASVSAPLSRVAGVPAELIDNARRGGTPSAVLDVVAGAPVLAFAAAVGHDTVLVEFYDLGPMRLELANLQRDLTLIALAVATVGVLAAVLAASGIQRPVRRVAAAARRLGQGELDIRLPVRGRDELADLTRSFNTMAGRLGESIEQQRRFIADVTHDLRTPVTAMVAAVDSLEDADPEARSRSARLLGTQTRRLARLVEDLLEISRFDAGVADFRPEPVDLRALLLDAVEASAGGADVEVTGDATVTADPRRLHTIACNLLANAVRHGAEPVTVTIDATRLDLVTVRFADSGPGVPADLMPILFDRFVRGERSRTAAGSGLGLAIARENALVHGGQLDVQNEAGAVFTLSLPRP
ncbi:sensor histidine kinase [Amycolatopsis arida]|nr:HAMP domain-containing sensor histidine kinase [Amycolatopsis arida]